MIMEFLIGIMFWFGIIAWHEFGHYAAYRFFGKMPTLKFKGISLFIGENVIKELKNWQAASVAMMGIIIGVIPLFLIQSVISTFSWYLLILLYIVSCYFDYRVIMRALEKPNAMFEG